MQFGDLNTNKFEYDIIDMGNIEKVDPVDYYFKQAVQGSLHHDKIIFKVHKSKFEAIEQVVDNPQEIINRVMVKRALRFASDSVKEIFNTNRLHFY